MNQAKWPLSEEPPCELLRLREVLDWLGATLHEVRRWEKRGLIRPLRKGNAGKAWYLKWELCLLLGWPQKMRTTQPQDPKIRRGDAVAWLGVPTAEFESWVRGGIISTVRGSKREKAFYLVSEIKKKILLQCGERWKAYCELVERGPVVGFRGFRYDRGRLFKWHPVSGKSAKDTIR